MPHAIYPYSEPIRFRPNLYQVRGSLPVPVPRNMTVFRSEQGELVLYSVIAMREEGMRALEALGTPTVMVIPNRRHQMDAPFYKQRYPQLQVLAPDASRVREVRVDGDLRELARYGIEAYVLPGNTYEDVVLDLPVADGRVLAVCESLGNVKLEGALGLLLRVLGPPGGGFGVARAVRLREIRGSAKLRRWLEQQSERSDLRALLFGHGDAITMDVPVALRRAASQL
jgi:hypothetical protein